MGFGYFPYLQGGEFPVLYDQNGVQVAHFRIDTTVRKWMGGDTSGQFLRIYSNSADGYPNITMEGLEDINLQVSTGKSVQVNDQTLLQLLHIHHDTTYPIWGGAGVTNQHLRFEANTVDHAPYIYFSGNGWITLSCKDVANGIIDYYKNTQHVGRFSEGTSTFKIESKGTNFDIELIPDGTGVLKFGTYTGGAATDSTGYITIKDAAGNTRKLMVQA